jgi:heme exporter protein A
VGDEKLFKGQNLACERGERLVFAGLGFSLGPGEALILTGPNGSGKSSLLRLMAGLLKPAEGQLLWEGQPLDEEPEAHRRRVHYLGHQEAVKPVLTLSENLSFWAALKGGDVGEAAILEALDRFGLKPLAELPARYLSAGQRRRLALARLLAAPGELWLLDEPTVGLDAASVQRLCKEIEAARERGARIVHATHLELPLAEVKRLDLAGLQSGVLLA